MDPGYYFKVGSGSVIFFPGSETLFSIQGTNACKQPVATKPPPNNTVGTKPVAAAAAQSSSDSSSSSDRKFFFRIFVLAIKITP